VSSFEALVTKYFAASLCNICILSRLRRAAFAFVAATKLARYNFTTLHLSLERYAIFLIFFVYSRPLQIVSTGSKLVVKYS
jgi:hypothetical protein